MVQIQLPQPPFVHEKRRGTEKWALRVGDTLLQLLTHASKNTPDPSIKLLITDIQVPNFEMGLLTWANNSVTVQFKYDLIGSDGQSLKKGSISGSGEGSAKEFGTILAFLPGIGKMNYDKGMELALSRALCNCISSLARDLDGVSKPS